jgi:hypothetical protein
VAKTFAKMTVGITALAVTTWFGTSSSRAYSDAPWCAVINLGKDVYRGLPIPHIRDAMGQTVGEMAPSSLEATRRWSIPCQNSTT